MTTSVELGWPLPKRIEQFLRLRDGQNSSPASWPLDFMGRKLFLPIWTVPLGLPKYRLANGRTTSLQQEWTADNLAAGADLFTRDPESLEAQKVQHGLLTKLINEKDLLPFFENKDNKQKGILILDSNGFAVNGNRRLCTWRILFAKDAHKYSHFAHVDVVVLPPADEAAIDELEAELQFAQPVEADYVWHSRANMFDNKMARYNLDEKAITARYRLKLGELRTLLDMRNYGAQYLAARGKESHWSLITDKKYAFEKMVEKRGKIPDAGRKSLFEIAAFALIDDPRGGRLYEAIPDLHTYLDNVRAKLLEEFPVQGGVEVKSDDLLGGNADEALDFALSKRLDDEASRVKVAEIVKDVVDTQKSLDRERDSANYVLKRLQKANAEVQSAVSGIRPETARTGVQETITSIEGALSRVKRWLGNDA